MIELTSIYGDGFADYFITEDGILISNRQNKQIRMKTYFDKQGYEYCKIWDNVNKRYKHISIHITVAMAYIPNPDNKETVNHKDRIKSHNYVDNLEWMTLKEMSPTQAMDCAIIQCVNCGKMVCSLNNLPANPKHQDMLQTNLMLVLMQ